MVWLHDTYPCPPIYITENGAYFDDTVSEDGKVHDARRIEFLDQYIRAMREAQAQGRRRPRLFRLVAAGQFRVGWRLPATFGLVKVDFDTLQRIPKDSYRWYRNFIGHHGNVSPQTASVSMNPTIDILWLLPSIQ